MSTLGSQSVPDQQGAAGSGVGQAADASWSWLNNGKKYSPNNWNRVMKVVNNFCPTLEMIIPLRQAELTFPYGA